MRLSCSMRPCLFGRRKLLFIIGMALLVVLFTLRRHYELTLVVGESMLPTLEQGELLLVDRQAYVHIGPQRGDVVLARYGRDLIIKRVVGLPGEEVEVRQGILYVNGVAQPEDHKIKQGNLVVVKGKLFDDDFATLGDNRAVPADLAIHPILSQPEILGKVVLPRKL